MKKSVVILIGIIYIASIALVGFLGIAFKEFDPVIPVEDVTITNTNLKYDPKTWGKYTTIYPDKDGNLTYQIEYKISPSNASNGEVDFLTDSTSVTISETGLVTFSAPTIAKIKIIAKDGSALEDTITIIAKAQK